jgi:BED zinc finger
MSTVEETVVEFDPSEDETPPPAKMTRSVTGLKREPKSDVWAYFQKNDLTGICNLCGKEVRHGGGTTNVRAHLRAKHHMVYVMGMDPTDPRVLEAETNKSPKKRTRRTGVKSEGSKVCFHHSSFHTHSPVALLDSQITLLMIK